LPLFTPSRALGGAVLAGLLQAASTAATPVPALDLLALMLLFICLQGVAPRRAALLGWAFGTTWLTLSVWWLYISMHRYGELPALLAAAAVLALALFLASYTALACAAVAWAGRGGRAGRLLPPLLFGSAWLLAELARAQWLTGFPWASAGYAHVDGLLAQLAPWVGVYGMGAVAAVLAAWLAGGVAASSRGDRAALQAPQAGAVRGAAGRSIDWRGRRGWLVATAITLGLLQWPLPPLLDFTRPAGTLSVTLLQGNVAQDEKFDPVRLPASLAWHDEALRGARTDLVVAPETAIALLPEDLPPEYWAGLRDHFSQGTVHALFGMPLGNAQGGYTNSAIGLGPGAAPYRYDKHHLVPFGEFIPLGFRWFVDLMRMPLGDFNRGALVAPSFKVKGLRVAPNICYEDLFGEELATRFANPATAPSVFVNISNMGWFAKPSASSMAIDQHLNISRMRALEFDRPMIRATNTGATVIINRKGVVTHSLARGTRGVLNGTVESGVATMTPYAKWAAQYGLQPLWVLVFALITILFLKRKYGFPPSRE
jgi:apolipoprotein N-acyltransferase